MMGFIGSILLFTISIGCGEKHSSSSSPSSSIFSFEGPKREYFR